MQTEEKIEKIRKTYNIQRKFKVKFDGKNTEIAMINLSNYEIFLNEESFSKLSEKAKLGIIAHEIGHYKFWPFDLKNHLKEISISYKIAKNLERSKEIVDWFNDLVNNLYVSSIFPEVSQAYLEIYEKIKPPSPIEKILSKYYEKITTLKFCNKKLNSLEEYFLEKLFFLIPFEDEERLLKVQLPYFSNWYIQLSKEIERKEKPIDRILLNKNETEKMIKRLIREKSMNVENLEFLKDFLNLENKIEARKMFYRNLSLSFRIEIAPILTRGKEIYPYSHTKWESKDSIYSIDIYTSFGKIIPGISNKWKSKPLKGFKEIRLPPLILLLDSSRSMPNPDKKVSEAIVSGYIIVREYLKKGSEVAVINFSEKTVGFGYSHRLEDVENGIVLYQNGETKIDVDTIKSFDERTDEEADMFVITDVGLNERENLIEFLNYMNKRKGRSFIFWIKGDNPKDLEEIKQSYKHINFNFIHDMKSLNRKVIRKIKNK